jgi:hypothetical protein
LQSQSQSKKNLACPRNKNPVPLRSASMCVHDLDSKLPSCLTDQQRLRQEHGKFQSDVCGTDDAVAMMLWLFVGAAFGCP